MKLSKSEVLFKFLKEDKSGIFAGSHAVVTPQPLVEDILNQIPDINNKTILVLFNVEFVISLVYNKGINTKNITFYSDNFNKIKFVNRMGVVNVITELDTTMKFDVVVGNPPFSDAGQKKNNVGNTKSLYDKFYKKSVEISRSVYMIMPDTTKQQRTTHNNYLKNTAYSMFKIESDVMDVTTKMVYVCYDEAKQANVAHMFTKFDVGNSVPFQKGKGGNAIPGSKNKFVRSVLKTGVDIISTGLDRDSAKITKNNVVFFSLRLNDSGFNVDVLDQAMGMIVGVNVYYIECDSADEAGKYAEMIKSPDFFQPLFSKRGNSNIITLAALKNAKC